MVKKYKLLQLIQERQKAFWVNLEDPETGEVFSSIWLPKKGCRIDLFENTVEVDEWVIDGNSDLNPVQRMVEDAFEYFETARNCLEYGMEILNEVRINIKRN